jgi:hypothetical protein
MKRGIKEAVARLVDRTELFALYLLGTNESFLRDAGWFRSFRQRESVDAGGRPIPWMTYASLRFLEPRLNRELSVFEYGSGSSTRWWAERVRQVVSCEHDREWHARLVKTCPSNVQLFQIDLVPGGDYSRKVGQYDAAFDVIVIDGRDRVSCARNAVGALKAGGVIVWDNSDRDLYREGYEFLEGRGFRRLDFWGMGPINIVSSCTSIFYRPDNCLGV